MNECEERATHILGTRETALFIVHLEERIAELEAQVAAFRAFVRADDVWLDSFFCGTCDYDLDANDVKYAARRAVEPFMGGA
jgi:hypothetical protein